MLTVRRTTTGGPFRVVGAWPAHSEKRQRPSSAWWWWVSSSWTSNNILAFNGTVSRCFRVITSVYHASNWLSRPA